MVVMVVVVGTAVIVVMVLLIIEFTCIKKVGKLKMVNKTSCNLTNLVYLLE